ncbi:hypothetical protein [Candidatus Lokiarchaeum ossiferum]|uniref:hypothetical protein n=1 Tax=Candidatus Lokiarchaeum ossiferum TaxID=2951803 RepID=UPI00352D6B2F
MSTEIPLDELEEWYLKSLQTRFKRQHKLLTKLFSNAEREMAEARTSLRTWTQRTLANEEEPLDPKNQSIMERFIDNVVEALESVKIPTVHVDITYENSMNFIDGIKKVYGIYNNQGKKSIPRFGKAYKIEIKEIDMHLRKMGNISAKVNKYMLKNYQDGKNAEGLLKKIPLLNNNIERLGTTKSKIEALDQEKIQMSDKLKEMEESLFDLSKDTDLQNLERIETLEQSKSTQLSDSLKFKKAFKKLLKGLEKGTIRAREIRTDQIKAYIKSPVTNIINDGPKIPQLRQILIKTRLMLEDEHDPLKLKSDLRERIIENINQIVSENSLEENIKEIIQIRDEKAECKKILEKKGLEQKRNELKEKIATLTVDFEHFENDLNRRKREFKELLEKVGNDRNELQKMVCEETFEDIKLKVMIPN